MTEGTPPIEIAPGIVRWTAPHPEWRTLIEWGHTVASYALAGHDDQGRDWLAFVDPLLPEDEGMRDAVIKDLDSLAETSTRLEILISIHYHLRSGEELFNRYAASLPARLWGNAAAAKRLTNPSTPFEAIDNRDGPADIAGIATAYPIGNPRRTETPLYFPSFKALAFGDTVVAVDGRARVWQQARYSRDWFRQRFLPTLQPLRELDVERLLITHGDAIVHNAREQLEAALDGPVWDYRGG